VLLREAGACPTAAAAGAAALLLATAVAFGLPRAQTARAKTVEFRLVAGQTAANGFFNFNGYARGALAVTVPLGWTVVIHYSNGSALRHSFDVIPYTGTQPDAAPPPAFAGAATKDLVDGIGVGKQEALTFNAGKTGRYEFLCGVLGHAQAGMWGLFVVSSAAAAPSVRPAGSVVFKIY